MENNGRTTLNIDGPPWTNDHEVADQKQDYDEDHGDSKLSVAIVCAGERVDEFLPADVSVTVVGVLLLPPR